MIKKVVYSHWSKPMGKSSAVGFNSLKMFAASAQLSVRLNLKYFKDVELVTDKAGYDLLIKRFKVPFTNVVVCLDEMNHVQSRHWNMAKLKACSLQTEPFMHQDLDVYWLKKPEDRLLNASVFAQDVENNPETDALFYKPYIDHAKEHFKDIPKYIDTSDYSAINCGVVGFNDLSIIDKWVEDAWSYVDYYEKFDVEATFKDLGGVVAEQAILYHLLKSRDTNVEYVLSKASEKYNKNDAGFIHLIASTKREPENEQLLMSRLASLSTEAFKSVHLL